MHYRHFGSTGIRVSALSLGVMNFGTMGNTDTDELARIFNTALDAGINLIDTADVYSQGGSERITGELLAKRRDRDELIIATKFHGRIGEGLNTGGNSRHWIARAVEGSLQRLGLDHIDLYQVHRPEPDTDIDETLGALSDLVRAGKIRYFGTSTFSGAQLVEARWTAQTRAHVRPVSEQLPYSILARDVEREVLEVARRYRLGVLAWSPLAGGWLAGPQHSKGNSRLGRQPERHALDIQENRQKLAAVEQLAALADASGLPLPQLALGFVLANQTVSSALLGPRIIEHLDDLLPAGDLELDAELLAEIDRIVTPGRTINSADTGYPIDHVTRVVAEQRRVH